MSAHIDRRAFLRSVPALAIVPRLRAQATEPPIKVRFFNHVSLTVSDLRRSIDFYQGLFGLPLRARGSTAAQLVIGPGPVHLALSTASTGMTPKIDHIGLAVDDFDIDRIVKLLARHGVAKSDQRGPMRVQVRASSGGPPEVHLGDPDGIDLQLQDPNDCGGTGPVGAICAAPDPPSTKGLIALKGYNHCTVFSTDALRSNAFARQVFGMSIRSYQGPSAPTLAVGPDVDFLMFTAAGGARTAGIHHFCFKLEKFDPDQILKTLERYGIRPRENQTGPVGPMRHYVSMRMENRGGAKEGTPELYLTDPDGIVVQLQDVSYCGGSGFLGNVCPAI